MTDLRTEYLRLKGALHDPNTGLMASAAVFEKVRGMFQRGMTVGIVHVEMDPGARVEKVYGWQVIDGLLQSVASDLEALRGDMLPAESVVAQSGVHADRFILFVPIPDPAPGADAVDAICSRVRERLAARFDGEEFRTMSPRPAPGVGGAAVTENPFFRLERQLDRGLDEARGQASREIAGERTRQHAELKRIIREQEIETLFQPIVELRTGTILGYEAFARGPRDSALESPESLFECSREVGMAGELDLLCQRLALRRAGKLDPGCVLFLNALPASLLDPGFREGLLAALPAGFPIGRKDIVLEIADRQSIDDYQAFGAEVMDLRASGFRMSIDDVGKAATGLESLSEVRPDFIKVDASLIRHLDENLIKQELLRSLCQVARTMNAEVIVEGIETREELEASRRCGARFGQGYLFRRPSVDIPKSRRVETPGI